MCRRNGERISVRGAESQDTYDLLGDDAGLRQACARGQWLARYDPIVPRVIPREAAFKVPAPERAIPFACIASTGNHCRIKPYTYKVLHDFSSLRLPEEPIPVRFRALRRLEQCHRQSHIYANSWSRPLRSRLAG